MERVDAAAGERAYLEWVRGRDAPLSSFLHFTSSSSPTPDQLRRAMVNFAGGLIVNSPMDMQITTSASSGSPTIINMGASATPADVARLRVQLGMPEPDEEFPF
jgi:hypothetical protein